MTEQEQQALIEGAKLIHPELRDHKCASDCVVARNPVTNQYTHVRHDKIREFVKAQGGLPKAPAAGTDDTAAPAKK